MMEIILLSLKILFILFFVGYGFTSIFIPEKLRKDSFFLIPWMGVILIAVIGITLSITQIPILYSKYIIFVIATLLTIYSIINKKALFLFSKDTPFLSLLTVICLLFNLLPLLLKYGYLTTISLGNLDPLSYVNVAEYLIYHPIFIKPEIFSSQPHFRAVGDLLYYSYRWGSPVILSFFSSIFDLRSYKIYSILITLLFSLSLPLVYLLAKNLINKSSKLLIFLLFLTYGMNSIILYILYNVFFAQFIFAGIFILTIILLNSYFSDNNIKNMQFNNYDLLIALGFSSMASIYPEGIFFAIGPLVIFAFINLFFKRKFQTQIYLIKIILLTIIINPIVLGNALHWDYTIFFSSTKSSFIGWEKVRYSTPFIMTGFYNLFYYKNLPILADIILSLPIMGICLYGLRKIKHTFFVISYLCIFGLFYILYWFIYPNYYLHLKLVSYLLFIFSIVFSVGLLFVFNRIRSKFLLFTTLIIISFLSLRSAIRTVNQLYYHARAVDKKLISLEELNSNVNINEFFFTSDVFLGEYDLWKRLWQEYLLKDKKIVTRTNYLDEKNLSEVKLVLSEKDVLEYDHKKITYKNIIWENEYYKLGEIIEQKK